MEIDVEQTYFNWASLIAQWVKNPTMKEILVQFLGWEDPLVTYINMLKYKLILRASKNWSRKQHCHGKSQATFPHHWGPLRLPLTFLQLDLNCPITVEKAMATHSGTPAWKISWTEEPGGLQSMGSRRVRHDWVTSLSLFTFMHWRRKWQPTPVFLPGESQGWGSLVGCRLWGRTESDTTEAT